jgi:hypothetical protein
MWTGKSISGKPKSSTRNRNQDCCGSDRSLIGCQCDLQLSGQAEFALL